MAADEQDLEYRVRLLEEQNAELIERIRILSVQDKEKHDLIKTLFDFAPFGLMILDRNRAVVQMNREGERILGLESHKGIGLSCGALLNCYNNFKCCPVLESDQSLYNQQSGCVKNNNILLRSTVRMTEGDEDFILEAFIDITGVEEAHAMEVLAARAKSDFLANIGHELRTPVHCIKGFVSMLPMVRDRPEKVDSMIGNIATSTDRLWNLIENLLNAAELQHATGEINITTTDMAAMFDALQAAYSPKASEMGCEVVFTSADDVGIIRADFLKINQVLNALLDNAIKYGGRHIECEASLERVGNDRWLQVCVRDDGPGVPADRQHAVFSVFEQVDNSESRPYQGAGLGLFLARRLADVMNGEITLSSEEGKGAEFCLRVPTEWHLVT